MAGKKSSWDDKGPSRGARAIGTFFMWGNILVSVVGIIFCAWTVYWRNADLWTCHTEPYYHYEGDEIVAVRPMGICGYTKDWAHVEANMAGVIGIHKDELPEARCIFVVDKYGKHPIVWGTSGEKVAKMVCTAGSPGDAYEW
ncbi:hypothetical protein DICA1_C15500 [Diutina catenulata]